MIVKLKTIFSWKMSTNRLERFLKTNKDKISDKDFTKMAMRKNFNQELKEEYSDRIDIDKIFLHGKLDTYNAYRLRDDIDWNYIHKKNEDKYHKFWDSVSSTNYLNLYEGKYHFMINWTIVTTKRCLLEEELFNLGKLIKWEKMTYSTQPFLTEDIIKKYIYIVDLNVIREKYFFRDKFIEEMMLLQADVRHKFHYANL